MESFGVAGGSYGQLVSCTSLMMKVMRLSIELDREDDGRWIAEIVELPGVMVYGNTRDQAIGAVQRLAVEVIADRIAHRELPPSCFNLSFSVPDEQLAGV